MEIYEPAFLVVFPLHSASKFHFFPETLPALEFFVGWFRQTLSPPALPSPRFCKSSWHMKGSRGSLEGRSRMRRMGSITIAPGYLYIPVDASRRLASARGSLFMLLVVVMVLPVDKWVCKFLSYRRNVERQKCVGVTVDWQLEPGHLHRGHSTHSGLFLKQTLHCTRRLPCSFTRPLHVCQKRCL